MTKLRKQRRRKVYRHNVNRKRLRNKIEKVGNIECKEIKNAWDRRKSVQTNLQEMGLSYDPNKTLAIPSNKSKLQVSTASNKEEWREEQHKKETDKSFVAKSLESDAKAPRLKKFRLPKKQVEWMSYLLDTYGLDYKAMARDRKNYNQETWKQLRQKIRKFKSVPEQFSVYLKERSLREEDFQSDDDLSDNEL